MRRTDDLGVGLRRCGQADGAADGELVEFLAEGVGGHEHGDHLRHALLSAQLLCAAGSKAGNGHGQLIRRGEHLRETAGGADGLLAGQVFQSYAVTPMQFLPCAQARDGHGFLNSGGRQAREVPCGLDASSGEAGCMASAYAPDILHGEEPEGTLALLLSVDEATFPVTRIALGKLAGHLGKRLRTRDSYTYGHSRPAAHLGSQCLAPRLEVRRHIGRLIEHQESLIDAIDKDVGGTLAQDVHHAARHVAIERVVAAQRMDLLSGETLRKLEERDALGDAHRLGFGAACHDAAVVVGEYHDGLAFQCGVEHALAGNITIVTIHQGVEHSEDKNSDFLGDSWPQRDYFSFFCLPMLNFSLSLCHQMTSVMNEVQILTAEVGKEVLLPYFPEGLRAGFPSPATDYEEEAIDLNKALIHNREATFFARVKGDSMMDAGYLPGDLLVVDRSLEPQSGDVVVAYVDGGFTVKELDLSERKQGIVRLLPHNKAYEPITITAEQTSIIWGVVTYCIHKNRTR